jgi:uncharacterized protein YkwD
MVIPCSSRSPYYRAADNDPDRQTAIGVAIPAAGTMKYLACTWLLLTGLLLVLAGALAPGQTSIASGPTLSPSPPTIDVFSAPSAAPLPLSAPTQAFSYTAFLPLVSRPEAPSGCDLNPQEQKIAQFMIDHPQQERPSLTCHPILAQVARERARDMAERHYFSHVNPDGYGPNYLVEQAGYDLPDYYNSALDANNIESIAGGYPTAEAAWQGWMDSDPHRTHLLGLLPFFAEQIDYGIGYIYDPASDYRHYWVVITARPGTD